MLQVNKMGMRQWMCGATKKDEIRDEHVRGSAQVALVTKKIVEKRLKRSGHGKAVLIRRCTSTEKERKTENQVE